MIPTEKKIAMEYVEYLQDKLQFEKAKFEGVRPAARTSRVVGQVEERSDDGDCTGKSRQQ